MIPKYLIASIALFAGITLFAQDRPNIVLIMTDDQGYADLSAMGNPVLETPHIDSLARDGASMDNFYVSPVCSPTRSVGSSSRLTSTER